MDNKRLSDKTVAITGGAKGLGKAITEAFAESGARLIIIGRSLESLKKESKELSTKGVQSLPMQIDITDPASVKRGVDKIRSYYDKIDILVNNAGGFLSGPIESFSDEDWEFSIRLNLSGAFYICKYFLPFLKNSMGAHIFFINSIGGKIGLKDASAYAASKFGLRGLAESLSEELRQYKIRITSVYPHRINSAGETIGDDDQRMRIIEPRDVAEQIVSVASTPMYLNIPEINIFPFFSGIVKRDDLE